MMRFTFNIQLAINQAYTACHKWDNQKQNNYRKLVFLRKITDFIQRKFVHKSKSNLQMSKVKSKG